MVNKLSHSEQHKVDTLSQEVSEVYEKYKDKIEEIIYNNYGVKKKEELLLLFKELGIVLSERNNELLDFLENKYGLNLRTDFDFSGGIKLPKDIISGDISEVIKGFFSKGYTREEGRNIHSRGYGYYFNFSGLGKEGANYKLDIGEYMKGLSGYYYDTISYLSEFNGKKISSLNESEKKILLVGLEHYKNILFFLQNFIISVSDKDYLTKHVLNLSPSTFNKYFVDVSGNGDFSEINNWIKGELEKVVIHFSDLSLGIESNNEEEDYKGLESVITDISKVNLGIDFSTGLKYKENENINKVFQIMSDLYEGSFDKQGKAVDELRNKKKTGGRQTNFKGVETALNRFNNKLIGKLIRIIREEDNPIKELLACHNILQNIPKEIKGVNIVGLLYGGIEMPYFMKYIFSRFSNKDIDAINIQLLGLSTYSNRNLMQTSALGNYKPLNGDTKNTEGSRLQLVLDDNSYYGTSLQVAANIGASRGPVYSGVAEIGLRRGTIGKLYEGSNMNHLLSKVPDSASVTPIEKNRGTYRNMVSRYIVKKLPGLVGHL